MIAGNFNSNFKFERAAQFPYEYQNNVVDTVPIGRNSNVTTDRKFPQIIIK